MTISTETITKVLELYTAYFNRAADKAGVEYWLSEMENNNWSLDQVAQSFAQSSEYQALYGRLNNTDIITKIYNNLLNREPDQAGLDYWASELESGAISVDKALVAIVNSATETIDGIAKNPEDKSIVDNKSAVSQYCYNNDINDNDISLENITTDSSSVDSITSSIDTTSNSDEQQSETNIGIGYPIYLKISETSEDLNDDYTGTTNYTYTYDSSTGYIISTSEWGSVSHQKYNTYGNMTEEISYENDVISSITSIEYNQKNQITQLVNASYEDGEKSGETTTTYLWTDNEVSFTLEGLFFTPTSLGTPLNDLGTDPLVLKVDYEGNGTYDEATYYTYNENGYEVQEEYDEDLDGTMDSITTYEWTLFS
jgi:hypothetical protein